MPCSDCSALHGESHLIKNQKHCRLNNNIKKSYSIKVTERNRISNIDRISTNILGIEQQRKNEKIVDN